MILDKFEHGAKIEWVETFVFAWVLGECRTFCNHPPEKGLLIFYFTSIVTPNC